MPTIAFAVTGPPQPTEATWPMGRVASTRKAGASSALLVVHKGIVRTIVEKLLKKPLEDGVPELGGIVSIGRDADDSWFEGRRSSNPPALEQAD